MIQSVTFDFLKDLAENNYREWFHENKPRYEAAHADMIAFAEDLYDKMIEEDNLVPRTGKKTLYRIYRDVRFSKDKAPYKQHWAGGFRRATPLLRGGYFFHVEPGKSFAAGGFWAPNKEDLLRIRQEFAADDKPIRAIIADDTFQQMFGELWGAELKTSPKGFDKEHPAIDLIRKKQFIVSRSFTDKQVLAPDFADQIVNTFFAMRPYFDYMSDVLTTDKNGVSIIEGN